MAKAIDSALFNAIVSLRLLSLFLLDDNMKLVPLVSFLGGVREFGEKKLFDLIFLLAVVFGSVLTV